MRKIKTKDVFELGRIITGSGVKDELLAVYQSGSASPEVVGWDVIFRILEVFTGKGMEGRLYAFIGQILEKPAEEVEDADLDVMMDDMMEIYKSNDLKRFFDAVSRLIQ